MNLLSNPGRFRHRRRHGHKRDYLDSTLKMTNTLANTPVGSKVQIVGFLPGLAGERRTQLQSYGLASGHTVKVLQHTPVTVLLIEQFELALERDLAAFVEVTASLLE